MSRVKNGSAQHSAGTDHIYLEGHCACHADAGLYGLGYRVQMNVARNYLVRGIDDADDRPVEFLVGIAHRVKERAVRGALLAYFRFIAFLREPPLCASQEISKRFSFVHLRTCAANPAQICKRAPKNETVISVQPLLYPERIA